MGKRAARPRPELSLVIPIYNEEEVLPQLDVRLKELLKKLAPHETEVVFVNDGSKDKSIEILRRMCSHELRYRVIGFSRNFGHQRAITAGMDKSRGQAIVVMDADLQDPPEVILEMVEKWKQGFDVVYGRRRSRVGESWFKLTSAKIFYRMFAAMIPIEVPLDTGDFRLMSRRVVLTMKGLRETHRFVRGLVAWVGFKQTAVEYDRAARAAGETKYPLKKMIQFAIDGIASFSIQPLRFATYVGVFVGTASVLYAIAAIISNYAGLTVPGWTTTVVLVSFLFSVQFFMIGVLGEYVGRIYEQVKRRPLYIISERINFRRANVENIRTQDLEELGGEQYESTTNLPQLEGEGTASGAGGSGAEAADAFPIPPPPPAIARAGAVAEAAISGQATPPPPPTKTVSGSVGVVTRPSTKPPPVVSKQPASVKNIHVTPVAPKPEPKAAGSTDQPSIPPPPALPKRPSIPAMKASAATAGKTPSIPPVGPKTPSIPPVGPKTPSIPPVAPKKESIAPKKQLDEKKSDEKKSAEKKSDEKKSDEKKADEKKSDEKKADEKKSDEKKADEKKADEKKADEKKADEKSGDEKKPGETKKS